MAYECARTSLKMEKPSFIEDHLPSQKMRQLDIACDVIPRWQRVGTSRNLGSDSEIADFLLHFYEERETAAQDRRCSLCGSVQVMRCLKCRTGLDQQHPEVQRQPSLKCQAKTSTPVAEDDTQEHRCFPDNCSLDGLLKETPPEDSGDISGDTGVLETGDDEFDNNPNDIGDSNALKTDHYEVSNNPDDFGDDAGAHRTDGDDDDIDRTLDDSGDVGSHGTDSKLVDADVDKASVKNNGPFQTRGERNRKAKQETGMDPGAEPCLQCCSKPSCSRCRGADKKLSSPSTCRTRDKVFQSRGALNGHMKTHSRAKPDLVCPASGDQAVESGESLKALLKTCFQANPELVCPTCDRVFKYRTSFHTHLKQHEVGPSAQHQKSSTSRQPARSSASLSSGERGQGVKHCHSHVQGATPSERHPCRENNATAEMRSEAQREVETSRFIPGSPLDSRNPHDLSLASTSQPSGRIEDCRQRESRDREIHTTPASEILTGSGREGLRPETEMSTKSPATEMPDTPPSGCVGSKADGSQMVVQRSAQPTNKRRRRKPPPSKTSAGQNPSLVAEDPRRKTTKDEVEVRQRGAVTCPACGARVSRARDLKIHMRVHTGEMPYECSSCKKPFRHRASYNLHMKRGCDHGGRRSRNPGGQQRVQAVDGRSTQAQAGTALRSSAATTAATVVKLEPADEEDRGSVRAAHVGWAPGISQRDFGRMCLRDDTQDQRSPTNASLKRSTLEDHSFEKGIPNATFADRLTRRLGSPQDGRDTARGHLTLHDDTHGEFAPHSDSRPTHERIVARQCNAEGKSSPQGDGRIIQQGKSPRQRCPKDIPGGNNLGQLSNPKGKVPPLQGAAVNQGERPLQDNTGGTTGRSHRHHRNRKGQFSLRDGAGITEGQQSMQDTSAGHRGNPKGCFTLHDSPVTREQQSLHDNTSDTSAGHRSNPKGHFPLRDSPVTREQQSLQDNNTGDNASGKSLGHRSNPNKEQLSLRAADVCGNAATCAPSDTTHPHPHPSSRLSKRSSTHPHRRPPDTTQEPKPPPSQEHEDPGRPPPPELMPFSQRPRGRGRRPLDPSKGVPCDVCGIRISRRRDLKIHMRVHSGEKPYLCSVCGEGFRQTAGLVAHTLRRHSGDRRPHVCDQCGAGFALIGSLNQHLRIHDPRRPRHGCRQCGKAFLRPSDLSDHLARHLGVKRCACGHCGRMFTTAREAAMHRTVHTGEKPHACGQCRKAFRLRKSLKRHALTHLKDGGARPASGAAHAAAKGLPG